MSKQPAEPTPKARIAFFVTVDWYFVSHYLALALTMLNAGYKVSVITAVDKQAKTIRAAGIELIPFPISRKGMHPVAELKTLRRLITVLRRLRPDLLHCIAQKPVLYGSLAARLTGVPAVIAALPGLGWLFTSGAPHARLGRRLALLGYRRLLRHRRVRVLVQNDTDRAQLKRLAGLDAIVVPGSGVDLERYQPGPAPPPPITIVLASRLLWDKGVGELVQAMRILHQRGVNCRCCLIGEPDEGNPASVPRQWLEARVAEGVVEWWGFRDDMPEVLRQAHIACLPSYREGLPKFLLEASAAGLPLVATDVPGCRDIVQSGTNGLLVPPRDAVALADALQGLIEDCGLRGRLGTQARAIAEARFGAERIAAIVKDVYRKLLMQPRHRSGRQPSSGEPRSG
jgi:glycosyltransferase involved in cell wall biosynthesis